jgi:purine nucleosidase
MKLFSLIAAIWLAATITPAMAQPARRLVIVDNDFGVPTSALQAIPLIASRDVQVLGLTTVIGDSYVPDDVMHTLGFLDMIGRGDIPVYAGANTPLLRTKAELDGWSRLYGTFPWKGAWNDPQPGHPATGPDDIQPMPAGPPRLKPAPGHAVTFLLDQVRAHPGAISIMAAGPLTNLALAVRLDPSFASHVKELVIMGGLVDANLKQVTDDANFNNDFNFKFDPEAADIVLTASFPRIRIVSGVANKVRLTPALLARVMAVKTPLTEYYDHFALKGLPLWDELTAAILLDPSLVTRSTKAYMRVDLDHGMNYGAAHVWPEEMRPHQGERQVEIVEDIDAERFQDLMVASLQTGATGHAVTAAPRQ